MADTTSSPARDGRTEPHAGADLAGRALRVLCGGVNSPVRSFRAVGAEPIFLTRANGPHVFDDRGRRYIDLVGAWGPAIVGHAHPSVVAAVRRAAEQGLSFGATSPAEIELAESIVDAFDSIELIRMVSSGTETVMSALRLARAATGREKVVKFLGCYHGHVDSLLVAAGSGASTLGRPDSAGVPESVAAQTLPAEYNDLPSVERRFADHHNAIAAVIVEPVAGNMGMVLPDEGFLSGLRAICDRFGALLIFDEVMTGFRVGWGGWQHVCGVRPDLTCLGKVIGGGLPAAAYGGRRELMSLVSPSGPVYQAGTLSGNPPAMAAGLATLDLCREPGFYERLDRQSSRLVTGIARVARAAGVDVATTQHAGMAGVFFTAKPVRNHADALACDRERFSRFFRAMLRRGVWWPPSPFEAVFVSASHDDAIIDEVIEAAGESFNEIQS